VIYGLKLYGHTPLTGTDLRWEDRCNGLSMWGVLYESGLPIVGSQVTRSGGVQKSIALRGHGLKNGQNPPAPPDHYLGD